MSDNLPTAAIFAAKTNNGHAVALKTWFMDKLGTTMGDRMFNEFVNFVSQSAAALPGVPGVLLDTKSGRVVSVKPMD